MPKQTLFDRLCKGCEKAGYSYCEKRSGKYRAYFYFNHQDGEPRYLFIGSNGALRIGPTATASYSIGDATRQTPFYKRLLDAGTIPDKTISFDGF